MKFIGKNVLIAGAGGALGNAVTAFFRLEGANVSITYRHRSENLRAASLKSIDAPDPFAISADLSQEKDVRRVISAVTREFGSLDILCNLVGAYMPATPTHTTHVDDWDAMYNANVRVAFLLTKHTIPVMMKHRFGRIIHMAAMTGLHPEADRCAYGSSKAALCYLTRASAEEVRRLAHRSITINAIAPSSIAPSQRGTRRLKDGAIRMVTQKQIVEVISFLASEAASSVNGEIISLQG
jgi:3-oxoacyl-[acyl-carrier protein] reductase